MAKAAKKKAELTQEEKLAQALVPVEEQPYQVPENWCWTRVGVLSSLHRGVSYKKDDAHVDKRKNDCLVMRGGNIGEGYIDTDADNVYVDLHIVNKDQLVKKNDIIIVASTGSTKVIGRAGISLVDYSDVAFGAFLMVVRPNKKTVPRYMDYFFQSDLYRNRIRDLASGVNINNIRADYITESPYPLPPLAEQQRIVDRIESLFAKLDEAKEKAQAVVDGFEDRRAAILHKAFTGELTAEWRKTVSIPTSSWKQYKYGELGVSKLGKMLDQAKNTGRSIPYLRNVNVRWFAFDLQDVSTMLASEVEIENLSVKNGDLFICEGGEPGRCAVWRDQDAEMIFQKALHRFRPNEKVISEFLCYYLFYLSLNQSLDKFFTGTTIKHLTGKSLAEIEIIVPSVDEQVQIVNILQHLFDTEQKAKEAAEQVIDQIDTMKKSILARAFRGELGTNDPDDEPTVELLKRIL